MPFKSPGSFLPVTGYRNGGPHRLKAGEWTDDTSMALALADSIAVAGWDLNDQADRYVQWWKTGNYSVNGHCFDIGITTRSALSTYVAKNDARTSHLAHVPIKPAVMARSCDWLRFQFVTSISTRTRSKSFLGLPKNRVCRRMPASSVYRHAGIWRQS